MTRIKGPPQRWWGRFHPLEAAADDQSRPGRRSTSQRTRRSAERTPAWMTCEWLNLCFGAHCVREDWQAFGPWCDELWGALDLPDEPCRDCPLVIREEVAA